MRDDLIFNSKVNVQSYCPLNVHCDEQQQQQK